jgi:1,4-alpha-glucan branching enzyme
MSTETNHSPTTAVDPLKIELEQLVAGEHGDPHHVLGAHSDGDGTVVRGYRPDAEAMTVVLPDGQRVGMTREHPAGVFRAHLEQPVTEVTERGYELEVRYPNGSTFTLDDPYRFWPTLGDLDLHLIGEGRHEQMWCNLGAHIRVHQDVAG